MKRAWSLVAVVLMCVVAGDVQAQTETRVVVRVVSHDAKIIGSGVGGARVVVRNPATGAVLAKGVQEGGTGSTSAIVVDPVARGSAIYDTPGAAAFTATVRLSAPTVLEFVGEAPLGYPQAVQRASKSMLVVPGQHILGDGVVLELHGFIVELLEPKRIPPGTDAIAVTARVRMLCGCPLEPGGLWDAARVAVSARVSAGERLVREVELAYAGEPNMFAGRVSLVGVPAGARVVVVAVDASRANFGGSTALAIH